MIGPFDYSTGMQSPLQSFQGAYGLGAGIRQQQAAAEADALALEQQALKIKEAEREAAFNEQKTALFDRLRKPGATAKDYADLAMILPKDESEALRESFKMLDAKAKESALAETAQIFTAFKAGKPDVAEALLRRQAEAERNAGNEQGAKLAETWADMVKVGPEGQKSIESLLGFSIAMMPGGDKAIEAANKYEAERRAQEDQPILFAQKQADLAKAKSDADKAKIEADYAEKLKIKDLEKIAADNGLTDAQKNKAIADASKLNADTARVVMETAALEANGELDPTKKFEQEEKLRKEYTGRVQKVIDMRNILANINASAKDMSGAGDIALVTGFMKMLDPGSVVRESEFATAQDTGGLLAKLQSMAKKVESGQFLSPQQRTEFARLAGEYMKGAEVHESRVKKDLGKVVENYKLNPENVFGAAENNGQPPAPPTSAAPAQAPIKVDF